jgi:hypothetical protein
MWNEYTAYKHTGLLSRHQQIPYAATYHAMVDLQYSIRSPQKSTRASTLEQALWNAGGSHRKG